MINYIYVVSFVMFFLFGIDKYAAIKSKRRISEKNLFLIAFFGGALAGIIAIKLFNHKTKKKYFMRSFILMMIIHVCLLVYFGI